MKILTATPTQRLFRLLFLSTAVVAFIEFWAAFLHFIKPLPNSIIPFSKNIFYSKVIALGLLQFIGAQFLIFITYAVCIGLITLQFSHCLKWPEKKMRLFALSLLFFSTFTIFLANDYCFPWSIFTVIPKNNFFNPLVKSLLCICCCIILIILSFALFAFYNRLPGKHRYKVSLMVLGVSIFFILTKLVAHSTTTNSLIALENKPNILVLSIDSLRPDYMGFFNQHGSETSTPYLDAFLKDASVFSQAYTPLSRSFGSWMTLLTGNTPRINGVRFNLAEMSHLKLDETLPAILKNNGYQTFFSTDGSQFLTISKKFGFDQVACTPLGFNNYVLPLLNDLPFSNFIVNTHLGALLFPFSYANREGSVTYTPAFYSQYVLNQLENTRAPLFLAIHLDLVHWPFYWKNCPRIKAENESIELELQYKAAIKAADEQFQQIMSGLQKMHFFDHAIVVVLSDHGEAHGLPGERLTAHTPYVGEKQLSSELVYALNQPTYGHGTDILNTKQFRILLGWKTIGTSLRFNPQINLTQIASIMDIKPTLLNLLKIPFQPVQGLSLKPWLTEQDQKDQTRDFMMETDMTVESLLAGNPSIKNVLNETLSYYQVNPQTGLVTFKPEFARWGIAGKHRGILRYPWFLVRYPDPKPSNPFFWILANLETHEWTTDLKSDFAKRAPTAQLYHAIKQSYGSEIPEDLSINFSK